MRGTGTKRLPLTLARGLLMLALGSVLAGCPRGDREPTRYVVQIEVLDGLTEAESSFARAALQAALQDATYLRGEGAEGTELQGKLRVSEIRSPTGAVLRLDVELDEPSALDARLGTGLEATVEVEPTDGKVELRRDLPLALDRAVAVLDARVTLARDQSEEVAALLRNDDPQIVVLALEQVTRKRQREHVDAVVPLLQHSDAQVTRAAVTAVGRIGGPEHGPALVSAAHLADRGHTSELYEALARVGGPEAIGFLSFASANEDDPDLAEVARRALIYALQREDGETGSQRDLGPLRGHR